MAPAAHVAREWIPSGLFRLVGPYLGLRIRCSGGAPDWRSAILQASGYDTPEIFAPRCSHELADGRAATLAHRRILQTSPTLSLAVVDRDHYGRPVADLMIDGRDVASLMIEAGHARAYDGHTARRAWCACAASS